MPNQYEDKEDLRAKAYDVLKHNIRISVGRIQGKPTFSGEYKEFVSYTYHSPQSPDEMTDQILHFMNAYIGKIKSRSNNDELATKTEMISSNANEEIDGIFERKGDIVAYGDLYQTEVLETLKDEILQLITQKQQALLEKLIAQSWIYANDEKAVPTRYLEAELAELTKQEGKG